MITSFGALMTLYVTNDDVGGTVVSLYPHVKIDGTFSKRAKFTTS